LAVPPGHLPADRVSGFHADLNETYPVGKVDKDSVRVMKASRDALYAAIAMCKPGALWRDIGKVMCVPPAPPAHADVVLTRTAQRADRARGRLRDGEAVHRPWHQQPLPPRADDPALCEEPSGRHDEAWHGTSPCLSAVTMAGTS
jgi:hypothetical protein